MIREMPWEKVVKLEESTQDNEAAQRTNRGDGGPFDGIQ
jgi:hypothetical protein